MEHMIRCHHAVLLSLAYFLASGSRRRLVHLALTCFAQARTHPEHL